jgi:WD40 repeat protein
MFLIVGSDGLVKLWTIKTNECIATYDKHDGKVRYHCHASRKSYFSVLLLEGAQTHYYLFQ